MNWLSDVNVYRSRPETAHDQTQRNRMTMALQFAGFGYDEAQRIFHAVIAPLDDDARMKILANLRSGCYSKKP